MPNLKLEDLPYSERSKDILENARKEMGFLPNMYAKMGYNTALLDAYILAYKSFRANSGFSAIEQEVVFLSVAYENNCEYCMSAQSFVADKVSGVPPRDHPCHPGGKRDTGQEVKRTIKAYKAAYH